MALACSLPSLFNFPFFNLTKSPFVTFPAVTLSRLHLIKSQFQFERQEIKDDTDELYALLLQKFL